jgi:hypothetical protein
MVTGAKHSSTLLELDADGDDDEDDDDTAGLLELSRENAHVLTTAQSSANSGASPVTASVVVRRATQSLGKQPQNLLLSRLAVAKLCQLL